MQRISVLIFQRNLDSIEKKLEAALQELRTSVARSIAMMESLEKANPEWAQRSREGHCPLCGRLKTDDLTALRKELDR